MLIQSGTTTVSGLSSFTAGGSLVFSGAQTGRLNADGASTFGDFSFFYYRAGDQQDSRGLVLEADVTVLAGSTVTFSNNSTGIGRIEMASNRVFDVGSGAMMEVDWVVDIFGGGQPEPHKKRGRCAVAQRQQHLQRSHHDQRGSSRRRERRCPRDKRRHHNQRRFASGFLRWRGRWEKHHTQQHEQQHGWAGFFVKLQRIHRRAHPPSRLDYRSW